MRLQVCPHAEQDHRRDRRAYAHVFHRPGVICVARALLELPDRYKLAILLHELGHVELGKTDHAELDADIVGGYLAGVRVYRSDSDFGHNLETISGRSIARARRYLSRELEA